MKRIFGLLILACLLAGMLGVTAAAEGEEGAAVLRISALKRDNTTEEIASHTSLAKGWNEAMSLASDTDKMKEKGYAYVVVDLLVDWKAKDGEFSNSGKGFNWDAIYFPEKSKVIFNLNGHSIDRGLDEYQYNGEVMYIDKKAEVIINGGANAEDNKLGTITGGYSCNGAGGIHINDDAKVTLNNVSVSGNSVEDDDGGGIAIYDDAELIMNGGSVSYNYSCLTVPFPGIWNYGCGIYCDDSKLTLNGVTLENNQTSGLNKGAAIAAFDSKVYIDNCRVLNNATEKRVDSVLFFDDGSLEIKNTLVQGNGLLLPDEPVEINGFDSNTFYCGSVDSLKILGCQFLSNCAGNTLMLNRSDFEMEDCTVENNMGRGLEAYAFYAGKGTMKNCRFNNNATSLIEDSFYIRGFSIDVIDCDLGDTTYHSGSKSKLKFKSSEEQTTGSIISEGSVVFVTSVASLIIAIAALVLVYTERKRAREGSKAASTADKKE